MFATRKIKWHNAFNKKVPKTGLEPATYGLAGALLYPVELLGDRWKLPARSQSLSHGRLIPGVILSGYRVEAVPVAWVISS